MAFVRGAIAGYGIAIPVGAIAILIISSALRHGFRVGFLAGAGAATADVFFASLAAVAGQVLSGLLAPVAVPLQVASGLVLIGLGAHGLWSLRRKPVAVRDGPALAVQTGGRTYWQFLGLTLLNPATITYFGSIILGGGVQASTPLDLALFVAGAGLASFSWQTLLAAFGAFAGQRLSPRVQSATIVFGNVLVIALGVGVLVASGMLQFMHA